MSLSPMILSETIVWHQDQLDADRQAADQLDAGVWGRHIWRLHQCHHSIGI
jgi:hypothetical protein